MISKYSICPRRLRNSSCLRVQSSAGYVVIGALLLLWVACKREEASKDPATPQTLHAAAGGESATSIVDLNNRGVGLMGKFEYENARQEFEKAIVLEPRNADLVVNLAIATLNRQREGDEDRAITLLDDALRADPSNLRAEYCLGILRLYLQSPEQAQPHFQKVADANANDAFAAYYLGQCLAQQKMYAEALEQYRRAIELDPHIRSAFYAASQAHRALGHDDDAAKMLAEFQALERNPQAHLAEFKYTRMGPKAMAQAIDDPQAQMVAATRPDGPIFLDPEPLLTNGDQFQWKAGAADRAVSITACDIDHDGDIDVFVANCLADDELHNAVCINDGTGKFTMAAEHALAKIPDVNAALWGDVDNDGLTDVYLCRKGANMLWRQTAKNVWTDVTASTQTDNNTLDSVDGALFDADHDGDLDIFVVNADGPNELFNNNLDGTFRPIAAEAGIAGAGKGSRQVLPVDLDDDRDLDIVVVNSEPPHDVWLNERAWKYVAADDVDSLRSASVDSMAVGDTNADGQPEAYLATRRTTGFNRAQRFRMLPDSAGVWRIDELLDPPDWGRGPEARDFGRPQVSLLDVDGSGQRSLVVFENDGTSIWRIEPNALVAGVGCAPCNVLGWSPVILDPTRGAALIGATAGGPRVYRPGPGRFPCATVAFTGKQVTSDNKQVRSNASGIGTHFAARIGSNWVTGDTLRGSSGPGQSLQPVSIGLSGAPKIDYLSINWSDGVFQTELDLDAGKHHLIEETQRQLSSCPVLFAWNGEHYQFITDLLGVGGIGYMVAPGEYAPSRPWENLLLPASALQPRDGQYVLKLDEPMEEACYLDAARLVAYDLPHGWGMTVDDRMNIAGPEPTGDAMLYQARSLRVAARAMNDRDQDVTESLRQVDLAPAPTGPVDARFIGLLEREHALTLAFSASPGSDAPADARPWALLIDGWIEYPYSQTMFAAWQANAAYQAPTLEMRAPGGEWKIIHEQFGYPAGMPRQMALPLPPDRDCSGAIELRIRTNQEIYFDRIALIDIEDCPEAKRVELPLAKAALADVGFALRTTGPQRQPAYDYDRRAPLWDTRHQHGWYTQFGCVDELISREDDALAIFGPGEEIELRFDAAVLPPLQTGWTRRFVLEARGWCKDMDLYTKDGESLEPLPSALPESDSAKRDELHARFNTRYMSGH